jgi:NAD(P)-dependent dehydrogenase (short-subunit alcohol dehydrogenase family)
VTGLLQGRRALVTGAARGIGAAAARRFCEEGAAVVLTDRDADAVDATTRALRSAGHHVHARALEVTDEEAVEAAVSEAADLLGGIDVVLANAGLLSLRRVGELSLAEFEQTLRVNVIGSFLTLRASVPHLRAAGGGVMLCTASQAGVRGYPEMSAYCASKFAVVGLVESLAQELASDGIRVCAVAPGLTDTEMYFGVVRGRATVWGVDEPSADDRLRDTLPLGRPAMADEVANAFVYLASPLASYVSGIALVVDGAELSG